MIEASSAGSKRKNAFDAGREAMEKAMAKHPHEPDIIWAFGAIRYNQRTLLKGIRSISKDIPVIGCTTDGEITSSGLSSDTVAVLCLSADQIRFPTVSVPHLSKGSFEAGVKIGDALYDCRCKYLQIFSDGLSGNATRVIDGIKKVLGDDIKIAGGAAGDGGQFRCTYQYGDDRILTDSIVAVGFAGDFHYGVGVGGGWTPFGVAKRVTKSIDNIVYELDGQPALQVYEKFLGKYAALLPSVGVEYPLALLGPDGNIEENGYVLSRATMGVDREKGAIRFAGDVPEGAFVKMTMGSEQDVIQAAQKAAEDAICQLKKKRPTAMPKAVFIYSCMARKIVLGSKAGEEFSHVKKGVGADTPTIGFYTYGEYAPVGKTNMSCFHNETITLTVIGE
jgi:hypothetical protein